jgi:hypothetical protein
MSADNVNMASVTVLKTSTGTGGGKQPASPESIATSLKGDLSSSLQIGDLQDVLAKVGDAFKGDPKHALDFALKYKLPLQTDPQWAKFQGSASESSAKAGVQSQIEFSARSQLMKILKDKGLSNTPVGQEIFDQVTSVLKNGDPGLEQLNSFMQSLISLDTITKDGGTAAKPAETTVSRVGQQWFKAALEDLKASCAKGAAESGSANDKSWGDMFADFVKMLANDGDGCTDNEFAALTSRLNEFFGNLGFNTKPVPVVADASTNNTVGSATGGASNGGNGVTSSSANPPTNFLFGSGQDLGRAFLSAGYARDYLSPESQAFFAMMDKATYGGQATPSVQTPVTPKSTPPSTSPSDEQTA